ncbi:membrane hypothetical protein [Paraburkholderia ribeironis]|uniref:Transmembrane protein n=1 Tax=Paraburkholderia ribeironis TaxID=1247936 RepID=A0A1N7S8R2_9BURK|nr:hypothetical protein [Paraburkholderia ribeironis]SIT43786.1 membrane hypothetical protein [Paraburkholderia ribeironis]
MATPVLAAVPDDEPVSSTFDELIFKRDLNEVHLLLDFISGRPDSHIWDIGDVKFPDRNDGNGALLTPYQVIERICEMRFPPPSGQNMADKADSAALLLYVKDKLNSVAYPACGLTIAYTYIFLEEIEGVARQAASSVRSRARALVARTAYPGLVVSAKRFRRFHKSVAWMGAAITLLAAILLWLVVYGVQLTSRFEENQRSTADVTSQIYVQVDKENAALAPEKQTHDSVPTRCHADRIEQQSNEIRLLCNQWSYFQARYDKSISDVATFANHWPSTWLMVPFPTSPGLREKAELGYVAKQVNIQSITLVLSAYASYVLPVMFGVVGTIASFLRDIGNRITSSTLAPRDETLAIIRLILGAIAGLAVGLFFTPASVSAQVSSGAGVLTLSASAIAFLAGYGADGFFRMIDMMITRVFSLDRPDKSSPAR